MAAVDGWQCQRGIIARCAVVRPAEFGDERGKPVDARQFPHPHMQVDRERFAFHHRPHMTQRGDVGQQEISRPISVAGNELNQSIKGPGLDTGLRKLPCQRQALDELEHLRAICGWLVGSQGAQRSLGDRLSTGRVCGVNRAKHRINIGGRQRRPFNARARTPLFEFHPSLGDHRGLVELHAENGASKIQHRRRFGLVTHGGGGCHRRHSTQRPHPVVSLYRRVCRVPVALQCKSETPQQHAHIGALSPVVGMELIEN